MNPQWLFINGSMPLFTLEPQTFLQMIPNSFNFVLVAVVITYLLHKPVKKLLDARADRVANDLAQAEADRKSAEAMKTDYEQKVKEIEHERGQVLEEARKIANEKRDEIIEAAKVEADALKDRAHRDIAAERNRVKAEVHQAIIDVSADMAAKLVAVTIDKNAHDKLFAEAMADLEATVFKPMEQAG